MPTLIQTILSSPIIYHLAVTLLTSFFWIAGLFGLLKFDVMVKTIKAHGLRRPSVVVAAMIATELIGSGLLITNVASLGWLGAGALGVFTFLSIPLGHPFWRFKSPKKMEEMQIALEHVAVVGGLIAAAILTTR